MAQHSKHPLEIFIWGYSFSLTHVLFDIIKGEACDSCQSPVHTLASVWELYVLHLCTLNGQAKIQTKSANQ